MSSGAILALCGIAQKQWKILAFLQCAAWEPGQRRTEEDRGGQNPSKSLEKPRVPACWAQGDLGGRPVASRGRRWISQGDMQKPLEKLWFSVGAPGFPGAHVPSRTEEDRGGQRRPETLKNLGNINNPTHVLLNLCTSLCHCSLAFI